MLLIFSFHDRARAFGARLSEVVISQDSFLNVWLAWTALILSNEISSVVQTANCVVDVVVGVASISILISVSMIIHTFRLKCYSFKCLILLCWDYTGANGQYTFLRVIRWWFIPTAHFWSLLCWVCVTNVIDFIKAQPETFWVRRDCCVKVMLRFISTSCVCYPLRGSIGLQYFCKKQQD